MIQPVACRPVPGILRGAAWAALITAAITLSGCSSIIADLPSPVGLPADAPARPATAPDYPAVHDMPPKRTDVVLTEEERKKMERELAAARDRQKAAAEKAAPSEPAVTQATGSTAKP
jgi:hypothetical protein